MRMINAHSNMTVTEQNKARTTFSTAFKQRNDQLENR